jgi:hypothetical protein
VNTAMTNLSWPEGKRFAFSIFDDTDNATVENVSPVYKCLLKLGIKTTKSVWPLRSDLSERSWGQSLEDLEYLGFVKELQNQGFEIAFHGARSGVNQRSVTLEALDAFREKIGHDPRCFAHHSVNRENLYWGANRCNLSFLRPFARRFSERPDFYGEAQDSEFYWADVCNQRIKYVRNYGFNTLNIRKNDPYTPYHDPSRPMVRNWFSTSYGLTPTNPKILFLPKRIRQWEMTGALVILQVHFADGFAHRGAVHPKFERGFEMLAKSNGWFAPVSEILDHIEATRGMHTLTSYQALMLELRWARDMGIKVTRNSLRRWLSR